MTFLGTSLWTGSSILLSIIIIFIGYFKWSFTYWNRRDVATLTPSIPFGNAKEVTARAETLGGSIAALYKHFKNKGLKFCGYYLTLRPVLVILDLDLTKTIMTKDFEHFMDHGNYINEKNDPLTGQLFMQKGVKWRNLRVKLTPTFTSGKMKMMFPTLLDCSRDLIVLMDKSAIDHTAVDIKDVIARFSTDVIGSCAFGLDCNTLKNPDSEFRKYGKEALNPTNSQNKILRILKSLVLPNFPFIMDTFKIPLFPKEIADFFLRIVRETVEYREKNGIIRKDFMHLLIQLKNNVQLKNDESAGVLKGQTSAKAFTIEEITAQAFVFFLAGFETSSTTLTFCFYELASNHELQDRLRHEITEVLQKYNGEVTYEALIDMVYMEKCINETLRKYPPLPILLRECTKTYRVPESSLVVEKGTRVFIPLLGIQRDPEYYPNPEVFDPERFNPDNNVKRHQFSWLPFGEGPRICIGQRFGIMQVKVALAILLKNYRFTVNPKTSNPLVMDPQSFIMSTKGGIWLNIEKI